MVELIPCPLGPLARRMLRELDERESVFDLPARKFVLGVPGRDLSVRFHGLRASTPLGPAAGPQSQMAQNLVLCWLGGSRILELKTVQILDSLDIPRPCIDMHNVGFNIEWSQELSLDESLEEYVKAAMLVEILRASGKLALAEGFTDTIWDMSVGYDLAGITSERVRAFLAGMRDAGAMVERLRGELRGDLAGYADLDFPTHISRTLTLSTFHGCPPEEIERILEFLIDELRLHCVVKLNPTLLGAESVREILRERLGYENLRTPEAAFTKDTTWEQMTGFVERLAARAERAGVGFGVKFTNTLIVENHRDFFPPDQKEMYLSGPPLHVLAMHLVARFRRHFGDAVPISFSAGIDRHNVADAVALGLTPITVCSDLLKPGGYARQHAYFERIEQRMAELGARSVDELVLRGFGHAEEAARRAGLDLNRVRTALREGGDLRAAAGGEGYARWLSQARLCNTETYLEGLDRDPRYTAAANSATPKKIGSRLVLFDCVTCDKCVPVCPNDANFTFAMPRVETTAAVLEHRDGAWVRTASRPLTLRKRHQIGNFADFCNECGNCDVFCPEDGGPYLVKPRFFGSRAGFERFAAHDGFWLGREDGEDVVLGRIDGRVLELRLREGERARYRGEGFDVRVDLDDPETGIEGTASAPVDLGWLRILVWLRDGVLAAPTVNHVNARA